MALTVAKSLPAGLHLYNTITGEMLACKLLLRGKQKFNKCGNYILVVILFTDDSVSLHRAGIQTNCDLFVWNGREVRKDNMRPPARTFFISNLVF